MAQTPKYGRVLLKVSGEALMGEQAYGLDPAAVDEMMEAIREHRSRSDAPEL